MRILLFAMPDTVSALDAVTALPNLGLASIAGSVTGHDVSVIDLAFYRRDISARVRSIAIREKPDIVGLSAMSFQYASACRVARIVRETAPRASIVLGGYHATLMHEEIAESTEGELFDHIVRGEGERAFPALVDAIGSGRGFSRIPGLTYRHTGVIRSNPPAPPLALSKIALPRRNARLIDRSRFLGMRFDCAETSRGCTMGCRFCSITEMYGRSIRHFPIPRIIDDLKQLRHSGVTGVFFVDDNITLNTAHCIALCRAIIAEGLDTLTYITQASVRGILADEALPPLLAQAGFRWVFLGIESDTAKNLRSLGKPSAPGDARAAVSRLRKNGIGVFGGFIVGNPDDTRNDITRAFQSARKTGVDHPIMQCLTPYPKTRTRDDLMREGLITNKNDFSRYNGFMANVRTHHLTNEALTRAMLIEGIKLYFDPLHILRSRFWRYHPSLWLPLFMNNFRYVSGAVRGRLFASRHCW